MAINTIEEILADFRLGKPVIIMDDEDRENEGDIIIAADAVKPEHITFFASDACGLICLTMTEQRARQLDLPLMVRSNKCQHETNFTVSIDAADLTGPGITSKQRAATILAAVASNAKPDDLVQPGHIFPLVAKPGGVLTRAGHTEAGCDLARMSGFEPASVIVEIINEDGTMARRPELEIFAEKHDLKIGTIADLIAYRAINDKTIELIDEKPISTRYGDLLLFAYRDLIDQYSLHYALVKGQINPDNPALVRVHVINTLRDLFYCERPDVKNKGWPLNDALAAIANADNGVLVLVAQRESVDEILEQIHLYPKLPSQIRSVKDQGVYRTIGTGSQILRDRNVGKMRLLSSPTRFNALSGFDLEITEFVTRKQ
jgi:3,4-dihydroxy 2-butanone 4-phosphate synthase/GTP cyclohydrolase II